MQDNIMIRMKQIQWYEKNRGDLLATLIVTKSY